jgi:enoyl-[acyl-carrier-protein] reductase (NADH)
MKTADADPRFIRDLPIRMQSSLRLVPAARCIPKPDCGEESYKGHDLLEEKRALITGGDNGIGRAVAIAFAREGADVAIPFLSEVQDAEETAGFVQESGKNAVLLEWDLSTKKACESIANDAVRSLGGVDILVNNAGFQRSLRKRFA